MKVKVKTRGQKAPQLKNKGVKRDRNKTLVVDLYMQGNSLRQVRELALEATGHSFGLDTISALIKEAQKEWAQSRDLIMTDHKSLELEKLNRMEAEAWEAWDKSKEVQYTYTERFTPKPTPARRRKATKELTQEELYEIPELTKQAKQTAGDPRYLDIAKWCWEQRCKLLGFEVARPTNQVVNNVTIMRKVVFEVKQRSLNSENNTTEAK